MNKNAPQQHSPDYMRPESCVIGGESKGSRNVRTSRMRKVHCGRNVIAGFVRDHAGGERVEQMYRTGCNEANLSFS